MAVLDCFKYVASKGDVKEFFGLRFGRFSARVQMVFGSFCICSVQMVFAIGWACIVLFCFMWIPKVT